MRVLKKYLQARLWRHSALAALLCTIVITLNILLGIVATKWFASFWLDVALLAFTPIWLLCYGLLFAAKWRWHELALGVFVSVLLIGLFYMRDMDSLAYKLSSCFACALGAALLVSIGFATGRLGQAISQDVRQAWSRRQERRRQHPPGSLFEG